MDHPTVVDTAVACVEFHRDLVPTLVLGDCKLLAEHRVGCSAMLKCLFVRARQKDCATVCLRGAVKRQPDGQLLVAEPILIPISVVLMRWDRAATWRLEKRLIGVENDIGPKELDNCFYRLRSESVAVAKDRIGVRGVEENPRLPIFNV
jgi:hypothetical protein